MSEPNINIGTCYGAQFCPLKFLEFKQRQQFTMKQIVSQSQNFFERVSEEITLCYPPLKYSRKFNKLCNNTMRRVEEEEKKVSQSHNNLKEDDKNWVKMLEEKQTEIKYKISEGRWRMKVMFDYEYPKDQISGFYLTSIENSLPEMDIKIVEVNDKEQNLGNKNQFQKEGRKCDKKEKKNGLFVQITLCQLKKRGEQSIYYVIYNGVKGATKCSVPESGQITFTEIVFKEISGEESCYYLFIGLFRQDDSNNRTYEDIYFSKPIFLAGPNKIVFVDDLPALKSYFSIFCADYKFKIKHPMFSQKESLERLEYQMGRNSAKIMNMLYLSYKYSQCCQLFLKTKAKIPKELEKGCTNEQSEQYTAKMNIWFKEALQILIKTREKIEELAELDFEPRLICNMVHPLSEIVFRIKEPFRKVKIVIAEQFGQFLSIVIGESEKINQKLNQFSEVPKDQVQDMYMEYYQKFKDVLPKSKFICSSEYKSFENQKRNSIIKSQENVSQEDHPKNTEQVDEPVKVKVEESDYENESQNNEQKIVDKEESQDKDWAEENEKIRRKKGRKTDADKKAILEAAGFDTRKLSKELMKSLHLKARKRYNKPNQKIQKSKKEQLTEKKAKKLQEIIIQGDQIPEMATPVVDFYELGKKYYEEMGKKEKETIKFQDKEKKYTTPKTQHERSEKQHQEYQRSDLGKKQKGYQKSLEVDSQKNFQEYLKNNYNRIDSLRHPINRFPSSYRLDCEEPYFNYISKGVPHRFSDNSIYSRYPSMSYQFPHSNYYNRELFSYSDRRNELPQLNRASRQYIRADPLDSGPMHLIEEVKQEKDDCPRCYRFEHLNDADGRKTGRIPACEAYREDLREFYGDSSKKKKLRSFYEDHPYE